LEEQSADEPGNECFVGENADNIGGAFDLAVEPLQRVCGMDFGAILGGEAHISEHVGLGVIEQAGEFWQNGGGLSAATYTTRGARPNRENYIFATIINKGS
jgi:hypothetical protein